MLSSRLFTENSIISNGWLLPSVFCPCNDNVFQYGLETLRQFSYQIMTERIAKAANSVKHLLPFSHKVLRQLLSYGKRHDHQHLRVISRWNRTTRGSDVRFQPIHNEVNILWGKGQVPTGSMQLKTGSRQIDMRTWRAWFLAILLSMNNVIFGCSCYSPLCTRYSI